MAERLNTTLRNAMVDAFKAAFDGGTLKIYADSSGVQPASANDPVPGTATLLATINLPSPAFNAGSGGAVAKTGTWSATVAASGTAVWFRIEGPGSNGKVFDGKIALTGSVGGEEILLDAIALLAGCTVTISTFTYTQQAG